VIFCNWITEIRDGNISNIVYTGIDIDWEHNETIEDITKTGYRLPSSNEWEYTARYRGTDTINTVSSYNNPCFTTGRSASGATTYYDDNSDGAGEPGKTASEAVSVYKYYWNADIATYIDKGTPDESIVKSLGTGSANSLGLYDMSGNVYEWCFTKYNSERRIRRGGSWDDYAGPCGSPGNDIANNRSGDVGFRLCRTAN